MAVLIPEREIDLVLGIVLERQLLAIQPAALLRAVGEGVVRVDAEIAQESRIRNHVAERQLGPRFEPLKRAALALDRPRHRHLAPDHAVLVGETALVGAGGDERSEEHTSELQSLMRN